MKKTKWIAMALLAAALAFVACKNIEEGGEIQQPPAPEQGSDGNGGANQGGESGGEQTPGGNGGSENLGGEEGNEGGNQGGEGGGENPGGEEGEGNPQPENPTTKAVSDLLKEIIGDAEYDAISAKAASGNLTLTAESVKAVYDFFPAFEKDAASGKEAIEVQNASIISQNKEAFVAQAEGAIEIKLGPIYPDWYEMYPEYFDEASAEKKCTVKYKKNFAFKGEFSLDELQFEKADGAQGNFDEATLKGAEISIDKLNTIRGSSLPTLSGNLKIGELGPGEINLHLYNLYSAYSKANKLGNLKISGNMEEFCIDGAKDKNNDPINGYTLFTDDDKAKPSSDPSVKSLPVDALVHMYEKLGIKKFINMIISGEPTESATVDWSLTNIVFEGDMSKIENKGVGKLNGIVYFENKPYKNDGQEVYGMLKLDRLEGVSTDTFGIQPDYRSGVLDVRCVDKKYIDNYNSGILWSDGYAHAIYFSNAFSSIKDAQEEINKLCDKFSNNQNRRFINAYFGNDRVHGQSYDESSVQTFSIIGAKNPRSLKEFEYFGNYGKFEKSAKDTYTTDEFKNLSDFDQGKLNDDKTNQVAQANKRIEFIDPETQKIIFSLANDRQYNS